MKKDKRESEKKEKWKKTEKTEEMVAMIRCTDVKPKFHPFWLAFFIFISFRHFPTFPHFPLRVDFGLASASGSIDDGHVGRPVHCGRRLFLFNFIQIFQGLIALVASSVLQIPNEMFARDGTNRISLRNKVFTHLTVC